MDALRPDQNTYDLTITLTNKKYLGKKPRLFEFELIETTTSLTENRGIVTANILPKDRKSLMKLFNSVLKDVNDPPRTCREFIDLLQKYPTIKALDWTLKMTYLSNQSWVDVVKQSIYLCKGAAHIVI